MNSLNLSSHAKLLLAVSDIHKLELITTAQKQTLKAQHPTILQILDVLQKSDNLSAVNQALLQILENQEQSNKNTSDNLSSVNSSKSIPNQRIKSRPSITIQKSNLKLSQNPSIKVNSFSEFSNGDDNQEDDGELIYRKSMKNMEKLDFSPLDEKLLGKKRQQGTRKTVKSFDQGLKIKFME